MVGVRVREGLSFVVTQFRVRIRVWEGFLFNQNSEEFLHLVSCFEIETLSRSDGMAATDQ